MKRLIIVAIISILLLSCSQDCKVTNCPDDNEIPLIEGMHYYMEKSDRSVYLGEYHLLNGEITFADSLGGSFITIKLIR